VTSRDLAEGVDHGEYDQAESGGDPEVCDCVLAEVIDYDRACSREDQTKGT
jgi:hypothetical protein